MGNIWSEEQLDPGVGVLGAVDHLIIDRSVMEEVRTYHQNGWTDWCHVWFIKWYCIGRPEKRDVTRVCNPVNWLSQTRRNLSIEYLNLNSVTTRKLTPLHSFYAEKVFVSFVWFISVSRVRTGPSLFDTDILQHTVLDLKFSTMSIPVDVSN